jgi:hypothetical protein
MTNLVQSRNVIIQMDPLCYCPLKPKLAFSKNINGPNATVASSMMPLTLTTMALRVTTLLMPRFLNPTPTMMLLAALLILWVNTMLLKLMINILSARPPILWNQNQRPYSLAYQLFTPQLVLLQRHTTTLHLQKCCLNQPHCLPHSLPQLPRPLRMTLLIIFGSRIQYMSSRTYSWGYLPSLLMELKP